MTDEQAFETIPWNINPLKHGVPYELLKRPVVIREGLVTGTFSTLDVFNTMISAIEMSTALKYYDGLRADIVLDVVLTSAVNNYGMMVLSWCYGNFVTFGMTNSLPHLLSMNGVMLDLSTQCSARLRIPYRYHKNFIEKAKLNYATLALFHAIYAIDGASNNLRCTIYGHFENPVPAYPVEPQSDMHPVLKYVAAGATVLSSVYSLSKEAVKVKEQADGLAENVSVLFGSGTEQAEGGTTHESLGIVEEPIVPVEARDYNVVQDAVKQSTTPMQIRTFGDTATTGGALTSNSLDTTATFPLIDLSVYGDKPGHSMYSVCSPPGFLLQHKMATPSWTETFQLGPHSSIGYFNYYSRLFSYWRGSIVFRMDIFGSPIYPARVQMWIDYKRSGSSTSSSLPRINTLTRGHHTISFVVPWLSYENVLEVTDFLANVKVQVDQQESAAFLLFTMAPAPDLQFFQPGRMFYAIPPLESVEPQSSLRAMCQAPNTTFADRLPSSCVSYMQPVTSLDQLVRRFDDVVRTNITIYPFTIAKRAANATDANEADLLEYVTACFLGWTGAIETKLTLSGALDTDYIYVQMSHVSGPSTVRSTMNGASVQLVQEWSVIETVQPYISPYPFQPIDGTPPAHLTAEIGMHGSATPTLEYGIRRAGPNFQLLYLNRIPFDQNTWNDYYSPTFP